MYGRAEEVVGVLLKDMQALDKPFIATKVWTSGEAAGIRQMNDLAAKMQAPIDLMQVHNLVDWRTHLKTLRAWKAQKKVRYIGITHYTVPGLDELAAVVRAEPAIDFVQFAFSINVRDAEARLLPLCAERGIATLINQPFDSGDLFRKVRGKALPAWAAEIECASWGQVLPQVHPGPPRRHLRHPRHRQARAHARQHRRGARPAPRCGRAQAHGGALGWAVRGGSSRGG